MLSREFQGWVIVCTSTTAYTTNPFRHLPWSLADPIYTIAGQWESRDHEGEGEGLWGLHQAGAPLPQLHLGQDPCGEREARWPLGSEAASPRAHVWPRDTPLWGLTAQRGGSTVGSSSSRWESPLPQVSSSLRRNLNLSELVLCLPVALRLWPQHLHFCLWGYRLGLMTVTSWQSCVDFTQGLPGVGSAFISGVISPGAWKEQCVSPCLTDTLSMWPWDSTLQLWDRSALPQPRALTCVSTDVETAVYEKPSPPFCFMKRVLL